MYHSGEAIFKIWSFLPHNYFFLLLGAICAGVMEAAQSWPFISPAVARPLFPGVYLFNGLGNEGYISLWGKAGHMSISLGADRITLLLSVCATNQPIPPQSIRPDIPVSALPYASRAHLQDICFSVLYLFVLSDHHALSHIRMFSICICRDHGIVFPFVYPSPRLVHTTIQR